MGITKLEKGQFLHKADQDTVSSVEVVVKGSIQISNAYSSIICNVGGFIGIVENPGTPYAYNYEALEETTVYSIRLMIFPKSSSPIPKSRLFLQLSHPKSQPNPALPMKNSSMMRFRNMSRSWLTTQIIQVFA